MIQGWMHLALLGGGFFIAVALAVSFGATLAFWAGIASVVILLLSVFGFIVLETQA